MMDSETSYRQAGYAGYDYFLESFDRLKKQFPKGSEGVLIQAASRMSIACAIEQLAGNVGGHVGDGNLGKALEVIASGNYFKSRF